LALDVGVGFEWVRYNYPDKPHNIREILLKSLQRSQSLVNLNEYTILVADDMIDELGLGGTVVACVWRAIRAPTVSCRISVIRTKLAYFIDSLKYGLLRF
jgi:hypothetical protein